MTSEEPYIEVTFTQDSIDLARQEGYIIKEGVAFLIDWEMKNRVEEREDIDYVRLLSEETLYQEGEATWSSVDDGTVIHATYDRPPLREWIRSEKEYNEKQFEETEFEQYKEWLDGQCTTLADVEGWL